MAANIDTTTGRASMMSYRENPWHKMGQVVSEKVTDPARCLDLAGLNWTVQEKPVFTAEVSKVGEETITTDVRQIDGFKALRRSDTGADLGVVTDQYQVFQNAEMFDVLAQIAGNREMWWETAGALDEGRIVWGLITVPELEIRIGDDRSIPYMLASQGHVGNRKLTIMPTTIRVVCQNTLAMADRAANGQTGLCRGFAIRHTSGLKAAVRDAITAYGGTVKAIETTRAAYEALAREELTTAKWAAYMEAVFRQEDATAAALSDETDRAKKLRVAREEALGRLLDSPTNRVKGTDRTMFAALQTVVEYVDHVRPTRGQNPDETRWKIANFGHAANIKARAMEEALALV